jgi:hypothetical protein
MERYIISFMIASSISSSSRSIGIDDECAAAAAADDDDDDDDEDDDDEPAAEGEDGRGEGFLDIAARASIELLYFENRTGGGGGAAAVVVVAAGIALVGRARARGRYALPCRCCWSSCCR